MISGIEKHIDRAKGIYRHTRIHAGMITPIDYNLLVRGIEIYDEHFAIMESKSSSSYTGMKAFVYMAGTPKEMARRFKEQA